MPIAAMLQFTAYVLASFAPPYPIFVSVFILNGMGFGWSDAHANSMGSRLPNASMRMSLLHAWFGVGATISPFISTTFVKHVPKAYRYYLVAAAVAFVVAVTLVAVFELRTTDQIVKSQDEGEGEESIPLVEPSGEDADDQPELKVKEKKKKQGSGDKMREILKMPSVYAIILYMFIYVSPPPSDLNTPLKYPADRIGSLDRRMGGKCSSTYTLRSSPDVHPDLVFDTRARR